MSGYGQVGLNVVDDESIRDADGNTLNSHRVGFLEPTSFAVSGGASLMAAADFNGDGRADLLTAGPNPTDPANMLNLRLGNGDGTFKQPLLVTFPLPPLAMTVADVNGDGALDILGIAGASENVFLTLGNGDGTFRSYTFTSVVPPSALAVGDVNRDGKPDLVVTKGSNASKGGVGVFLGNGDGTFRPGTSFETTRYDAVVISDVNLDRKPDLIVGSSGNVAYVLFGNGGHLHRPERRP
jgi:hypothetical protein